MWQKFRALTSTVVSLWVEWHCPSCTLFCKDVCVLSVFAIQVVLVKMGSCSVLTLLSLHTSPFLTGIRSSLKLFFYLYVCWLDHMYLLRYFLLHFFCHCILQNKTEIPGVFPGGLTVFLQCHLCFCKRELISNCSKDYVFPSSEK